MSMDISKKQSSERVFDVRFDDHRLIVDLMDGRTISVPLTWYRASQAPPPNSARIGKNAAAAMASTGPMWTRT